MLRATITFFVLFFTVGAFAQVRNVGSEEFRKLIDENKNSQLIDLRTDAEIARKGRIKGARQIDFLSTRADSLLSTLDKTRPVLLYCAGGGRSSDCAEQLKKLGFRDVINLEKGYDDWSRRGFETETVTPAAK